MGQTESQYPRKGSVLNSVRKAFAQTSSPRDSRTSVSVSVETTDQELYEMMNDFDLEQVQSANAFV